MGCWVLDNKILICLALCHRYFGYSSDEELGLDIWKYQCVLAFCHRYIYIYGILCSMEFLITCHHLAPLLLKDLKRKRYHTYVPSRYDICFSPWWLGFASVCHRSRETFTFPTKQN
jgi:hypothetical protein